MTLCETVKPTEGGVMATLMGGACGVGAGLPVTTSGPSHNPANIATKPRIDLQIVFEVTTALMNPPELACACDG
jgi:hypothetical protein